MYDNFMSVWGLGYLIFALTLAFGRISKSFLCEIQLFAKHSLQYFLYEYLGDATKHSFFRPLKACSCEFAGAALLSDFEVADPILSRRFVLFIGVIAHRSCKIPLCSYELLGVISEPTESLL
jgi:hypothetical protein